LKSNDRPTLFTAGDANAFWRKQMNLSSGPGRMASTGWRLQNYQSHWSMMVRSRGIAPLFSKDLNWLVNF
jgi:hypothetical protein